MENIEEMLKKLESYIDKEGLSQTLFDISRVCFEKSAHINEQFQDKITAKFWERNCFRISELARKIG